MYIKKLYTWYVKVEVLESLFLYQHFRRDDEGEEKDDDEAGDEDQVGGEEGEFQVETMGTRSRYQSKGSAEPCQNSGIK